jgi:hypothetical protein
MFTSVNPIHHSKEKEWSPRRESNPQPSDYRSLALPIELLGLIKENGRGERIRTSDLLIPGQELYHTELHPTLHSIR